MGADFYQTEAEIMSMLAEGKVPISVGENTKIRNLWHGVEEGDMPEEGFCIRSVIAVVVKNATIRDGMIV
ncbi:hypothetical protein F2Q68_00005682 [Brassica cretica]|uniref:glucose-1-phosphate adenylyltransferase n=1 Tax=Brassica cretica TaxID=69181 RepID=A0A8S9JJ55_BRACR|nr:hypothetical protein F2Q68_00005682 [Brassica cretica]KAF3515306.1 hypothetical protein F2Q69_00008145 [Brassica cretica]